MVNIPASEVPLFDSDGSFPPAEAADNVRRKGCSSAGVSLTVVATEPEGQ